MKGSVYWDHQNIYLLLKRSTFTLKWTNPLQTKKNTHQSITTSPTKLSLEYRLHKSPINHLLWFFINSNNSRREKLPNIFPLAFGIALRTLHNGNVQPSTLEKQKSHPNHLHNSRYYCLIGIATSQKSLPFAFETGLSIFLCTSYRKCGHKEDSYESSKHT